MVRERPAFLIVALTILITANPISVRKSFRIDVSSEDWVMQAGCHDAERGLHPAQSMSSNGTRHKSDTVMLLIDVINHFEFSDGPRLLKEALRIAPNIARLKARARRSNIPVLYVNDNFGQWRSDARKLLGYCLRSEAKGREFVNWVRPEEDDYFVLKPMHSAFYQSPLEVLLRNFESSTLVITGLATDSCIVCTAHDADMREFNLVVPADCCASRSSRDHRRALEHIRTLKHASIVQSASIRFPTASGT